ncbi:MAG: DUF4270 family protein [Bacteroidales bacterium]|nr:DUF4270 family protein [Bacteroidales bacterium]
MNFAISVRNPVACMFIILMAMLFSSCNEDDNTFTIGNDFTESTTHIIVLDTFTVEMSTVVLDSVPTSGTEAMLIGNFRDTLFGNTRCSSFFQIGLPEYIKLNADDVYDSMSLIIHYSGYYYGDTNTFMQLNVYQLAEDIQLHDNGYLYNTSSFNHNSDTLGIAQFWPSPDASRSVEIKLKDTVGLDLFTKIVEGASEVQSDNSFLNYFKGIVIYADESTENTVIGFKADQENLMMRMYTHRIDQIDVATTFDFPLVNTYYQFNQIHYDFRNTLLESTDNEKTAIPSAVAGNKAFVQGYRKIMTKIQFPTMPNILLNERGIIMKAELVFYPERSSYANFNLPGFVILYETNKKNRPLNLITEANGTTQVAKLVIDEYYNEETYYTFNVTDFINNELSDRYYDTDHGLLISLYDETYQLNLERIVIETKRPAPRLKVYYMTY